MILFLYGDDTYRSRVRLHTLRDAFREKHDPTGLNLVREAGEQLTADTLITHLSVQGFLTPKRFIVVEQFCSAGKPGEIEATLDYLATHDFATDNILVFWEEGEQPATKKRGAQDAGNNLWQQLVDHAKVEHFAPLSPTLLTKWYTQQIASRGGTIERNALLHLIHLVGMDLWHASAEIEKLVAYAHGQAITEADIDLLVLAPVDENVFALTDAIGQKNTGVALRLLENQFLQGTAPLYLLRMFAWHVRNLVSVRSLMDEGNANPKSIAKELHLHPFVAQKTMRQASSFSLDELRRLYSELLDIDHTLKSRSVDPRVLLSMLLVPLSSQTPR